MGQCPRLARFAKDRANPFNYGEITLHERLLEQASTVSIELVLPESLESPAPANLSYED